MVIILRQLQIKTLWIRIHCTLVLQVCFKKSALLPRIFLFQNYYIPRITELGGMANSPPESFVEDDSQHNVDGKVTWATIRQAESSNG